MGTENWFPIGFSDKFAGTTVPTKIVGTPYCGILLAAPTNLSELYTFYNAAWITTLIKEVSNGDDNSITDQGILTNKSTRIG